MKQFDCDDFEAFTRLSKLQARNKFSGCTILNKFKMKVPIIYQVYGRIKCTIHYWMLYSVLLHLLNVTVHHKLPVKSASRFLNKISFEFHTLRAHYAHAAANLNSGYSKYAKVARVHYFCTIALRTSRAVLTRAWASRRVGFTRA